MLHYYHHQHLLLHRSQKNKTETRPSSSGFKEFMSRFNPFYSASSESTSRDIMYTGYLILSKWRVWLQLQKERSESRLSKLLIDEGGQGLIILIKRWNLSGMVLIPLSRQWEIMPSNSTFHLIGVCIQCSILIFLSLVGEWYRRSIVSFRVCCCSKQQ